MSIPDYVVITLLTCGFIHLGIANAFELLQSLGSVKTRSPGLGANIGEGQPSRFP